MITHQLAQVTLAAAHRLDALALAPLVDQLPRDAEQARRLGLEDEPAVEQVEHVRAPVFADVHRSLAGHRPSD